MTLTDRYAQALAFAHDAHRGHLRKGTSTPYLSHLLAVSGLVMEHGGDEDQAIAGLLHDCVEDVGVHLREPIRERFGDGVLAIVDGLTDAVTQPKPPWRERKVAYVEHLRTAPLPVLRVCAADKLHNLRCILADYRVHGPALWDRFNAGPADTYWYYTAVTDTLAAAGAPDTLVNELRDVQAACVREGAFEAIVRA
jgi:(p)ppGpp synthase/HD superfamily hydrolase